MKLKKINKTFKKNGFNYNQIKRKKNIVLFKQWMDTKSDTILAYEVHKIRIRKVPRMWADSPSFKDYEKYEALAGDSDFGQYGWAFMGLKYAQEKFNELIKTK